MGRGDALARIAGLDDLVAVWWLPLGQTVFSSAECDDSETEFHDLLMAKAAGVDPVPANGEHEAHGALGVTFADVYRVFGRMLDSLGVWRDDPGRMSAVLVAYRLLAADGQSPGDWRLIWIVRTAYYRGAVVDG